MFQRGLKCLGGSPFPVVEITKMSGVEEREGKVRWSNAWIESGREGGREGGKRE